MSPPSVSNEFIIQALCTGSCLCSEAKLSDKPPIRRLTLDENQHNLPQKTEKDTIIERLKKLLLERTCFNSAKETFYTRLIPRFLSGPLTHCKLNETSHTIIVIC